jgi:hypothetical protein
MCLNYVIWFGLLFKTMHNLAICKISHFCGQPSHMVAKYALVGYTPGPHQQTQFRIHKRKA